MSHNYKETPKNICYDSNHSDSNDSEWGLEIVIKTTPKKRKKKSIDPKDKEIIDEFEKNIEDTLEEKAAKSNLSHSTVKSILKHVFTDEHVLALVKQKEGCEDVEGIIPYEPKITRSKAKELYSNAGSLISLPWQMPTEASEVQVLLTQDLQEDSSGDEYVPGEEDSEDDANVSISNPPTPVAPQGTLNTDDIDEVSKTPHRKQKKYTKTEKGNIALRTRSKFCLSQTSLEKIEQAFIPPDITTDMYEIYCKDDEWKEFLKSFTQPLEEVAKGAEDEDHDPEYNFLSDEEIDTVDKEELREDKAVKVPRKELNDLMAELFEYVDIYSNKTDQEKMEYETSSDTTNQIQQQLFDSCIEILDGPNFGNSFTTKICQSFPNFKRDEIEATELSLSNAFTQSQLLLLHQQMRQHVQMLTQNFLLTYCHPIYGNFSSKLKEYLLNFKFLSNKNKLSVFNCTNLENSVKLVDEWERLFKDDHEEALETIKQYAEVMEKSMKLHSKREYYHLPFPQLVLKTIADNNIFIYPHLLPRIPFKHPELLKKDILPFSYSEYQLIALGQEQFISYFINDEEFLTRKKQINLKKISELIHQLMMPARQPSQIYRQMIDKKPEKYLPNPIAYYNMHQKAPLTIHQVNPFIHFETVPPRKRPPTLLPLQWRNYIWPDWRKEQDCGEQYFPKPSLIFNEPKKQKPSKPLNKLLPKKSSSPIMYNKKDAPSSERKPNKRCLQSFKKKFIKCFLSTIPYSEYYALRKKEENLNNSFAPEKVSYSLSEKDFLKGDNMPCLNLSNNSKINITQGDTKLVSGVQELKTGTDHSIGEEKNDSAVHNLSSFENIECNKIRTMNICDLNSSEMFIKIERDNVGENHNIKGIMSEKEELSSNTCENKTKRKMGHLSSLAMLSPPELSIEKEKKLQFAQIYFEKFKKTLNQADYSKAVYSVRNSYTKTSNAMDLYKILEPILNPKYKNLVDELLLFLDLELANAIGKLIPFFLTNHRDKFRQTLEDCLEDQPLQLRKINQSFLEVDDSQSIILEKVKNSILPLLRSHPLLSYRFLKIFLEDTSSLFNSTWEIDDTNKKLGMTDDETYSNSISAVEYCVCFCHKVNDPQSQQQCLNCGLRFVHGKIYCHNSKGFKLVNITFPFDPNIDNDMQTHIKPLDHSSSKILNSQCVDTWETVPAFNNTIENIREYGLRSKSKPKFCSRATKKVFKIHIKKNRVKSIQFNGKRSICISESASLKETENTIDDANCNSMISQYVDVEASNSKLSQNDLKMNSSFLKTMENRSLWSREEDKLILQTFREFEEEAIQLIGKQLKNRSAEDIRTRFEMLMALLQEMES